MDIKQMIYFKTIVEEGTISKAAQTLHIAQPPLSIQLKLLEDELGVQLLKRGHRKVELTSAGKLFYKRCLQIITLSEITKHELKETNQEILHLGITSSNGALMKQIQPYLISQPKLSYHIHEGSTYELIDLLLSHNIDLGIVRTPFDQSQVNVYPYRSEAMIAVGKKEFINDSMKRMKNYQNIPLIIHQRYLSLISDHCLRLHFHPLIKMSCDDCRTSLLWAQLGLGVAIIPESALEFCQNHNLSSVILEDKELYTRIAFITRKNETPTLKVKNFIEQFI